MKKKKTASRILAATLSTAVTLSFVPVSAFAEQLIETETMIEEESFLLNETNYESETEPVQETVSEETMQELSPPEAEPIQADFPVLGDEANEGTEETDPVDPGTQEGADHRGVRHRSAHCYRASHQESRGHQGALVFAPGGRRKAGCPCGEDSAG